LLIGLAEFFEWNRDFFAVFLLEQDVAGFDSQQLGFDLVLTLGNRIPGA